MIIGYHPLTYGLDGDESVLSELRTLGVHVESLRELADGSMVGPGFYFKRILVKLMPDEVLRLRSELKGWVEQMIPNHQFKVKQGETPAYTPLVMRDGHTPSENLTDKDTNPKDVIGSGKLPLSLVPETLAIYACLAFLEGAMKYGRYNWRIAGVRSSIYIDALKRHIAKYESGEDVDPETGVPHLSNMLACIGIIVDAKVCDKLTDDRPPKAPLVPALINEMIEDVASVKGRLAKHHPHQYTIADSPRKQS